MESGGRPIGPPVLFVSPLGERLVIFRKPIAELSERALATFVGRARRAARLDGDVHVLVTTNREMRSLNARFRKKDKPTDVLSFPAEFPARSAIAGDLAISGEIAAENARLLGHSVASEIKILTLHGVLHLAGYDHEADGGEKARREITLRKSLNLPLSLIERTANQPSSRGKTKSAVASKAKRRAAR
jgi:probable rRNA maturation factor